MTRLRTSPDQRSDRALPAVRPFLRSAGATPPPRPAADGTPAERYPTSRVRPTSQLMARGGLLAAVAVGCVGGLVGLLRSPGDGGADVPPPRGETDVLPGSVAGVAERAVEAWLTADPGGDAGVDALFVPPAPVGPGRDAEPLAVEQATAIAGERSEDGYWIVIMAVDDVRDRAIITNLYWGCFRGSELAAMRWRHAVVIDQGIEWRVPRAKTDQQGEGKTVGVPRHPNPWLCPVLAVGDWRSAYETLLGRPVTANDPVFPTLDRRTRLTDPIHRDAINDIIRRAATRAGLVGDYGSHSPRAGFTTDCIDAGIPREHVQHHGRWTNIRSLDPYYRKTSTWGRTNPAARLAQHDD